MEFINRIVRAAEGYAAIDDDVGVAEWLLTRHQIADGLLRIDVASGQNKSPPVQILAYTSKCVASSRGCAANHLIRKHVFVFWQAEKSRFRVRSPTVRRAIAMASAALIGPVSRRRAHGALSRATAMTHRLHHNYGD
jgi:hypothetical protein